jgi:hypothetical protein
VTFSQQKPGRLFSRSSTWRQLAARATNTAWHQSKSEWRLEIAAVFRPHSKAKRHPPLLLVARTAWSSCMDLIIWIQTFSQIPNLFPFLPFKHWQLCPRVGVRTPFSLPLSLLPIVHWALDWVPGAFCARPIAVSCFFHFLLSACTRAFQ